MEYNEKEIQELYATLKTVSAVRKAYNRNRVRKEQISVAQTERFLNAYNDAAPQPSVWLIVIAAGIFVSSAIHLFTLAVQKDWYWEIHAYLSEPFLTLRYITSFCQRFFGIAVGIGILRLHELSRKALIGLGIFSILVLPWKHSYKGFVLHTAILDEKYAELLALMNGFAGTEWTFSAAVIPSMLAHWLLDASFWVVLFWYLTRPKVKALFKPQP